MVRNINISTGFNTIKLENPFVIEMVYEILKMKANVDIKEKTKIREHTPRLRFTFKKDVLEEMKIDVITILHSLELILNNAGELVIFNYASKYYRQEDEFTSFFIHQLIVFYGSNQKEFIDGCWKLYDDVEYLLAGLVVLIKDDGKSFRFNDNADIWDFYEKKDRRN